MGLLSWLSRSCPRPAARTRATRPALEPLETRDVPAAALTDTFVASVYQGFLGRALDTQGLGFWNNRLVTGTTREQVVAGILDSPEEHGRQLQILYRLYLNRVIDPNGLAFWGDAIERGGATFEQVKTSILASPEFFTRVGNTNRDWLSSVYGSQLGRPLDLAGEGFWVSRLNAGATRQDVVAAILASDEAIRLKVAGTYQEILARPLDSAGDAFWGDALRAGLPLESLFAGVAGSDEFRDQLFGFLSRTTANDANVAADGFLVEGARFDTVVAAIEILNRGIPTDRRINTLTVTIPGVGGTAQTTVAPGTTGSFLGTTVGPQGVQTPLGPLFSPGVTQSVAGTTAAQTFLVGPQTVFPVGGTLFPAGTILTPNLTSPQGTVQLSPGSVLVSPLAGLGTTSMVTPFASTLGTSFTPLGL